MYERVGAVSAGTIARLQKIAEKSTWKIVQDDEKNFRTCYIELAIPELLKRWDRWHSSFFLLIPPGGMIHKHIDTHRVWNTYHVVVQTNDDCISYVEDKPFHLEVGGIYSIDRSVEHHSVNNGETDRIHLLAEVYE